jgi:DNA-directed RNA polymerase specialized sigma24 family protein
VFEEDTESALSQIAKAVEARRPVTQEDVSLVTRVAERWLGSRVRDVQIRHDAAVESTYRFVVAARAGTFRDGRPVGSWLRVVSQRIAIDYVRRTRRQAPAQLLLFDVSSADDEIARLLDGADSAERIKQGLKAAVDAGDYELVRLLTTWLDLAESRGGVPPSREVAAIAQVSHMRIQRALQRFRRYLSDAEPNPPDEI